MDLLAENNVCGQALLRLVARGNAIIAELMRLSEYVPQVFRLETRIEQQKYGDVVLDFTYLKAAEGFNKKIEDSPTLLDIDDEIRESHSNILSRIYAVFESIHRYVTDLNGFLQDLGEGIFIQRTLENMFTNEDGKQLMCEALYLYGVMLLVVDTLFPGLVRERIIVTHHRHAGQKASDTNIDDVCKLLRSTGFSALPGSKRPLNYPEDYFRRVELPSNYLNLVLGHLRSDDIYHQVQAYPSPEHRSAALANQSAMLFVCLYFSCYVHSQRVVMNAVSPKEFHGLESSAGVVQAVGEVVSALQALVRVAGVTEDNLITLSLISDLSYAWILVDEYTPIMQSAIKKDASHVAKLRATFLKLSSGLELPLLRINQARSPDLISVSAYYSGELVAYVRKVLQIIPETMFGLLAKIIGLQTEKIKEVPTRLDKDKMREFAQLPERYQMAELSHSVAVLAEGVAMMETTLVGVIQVDPRRLLEDGVRRELVFLVAQILHDGLTFNTKVKGSELYKRLTLVGQKMTGFRISFEYIQDYISMYGLKIWQEELSRIVNYNVEQECNQLLKKKISDHESIYQSVAIPIPKFPSGDSQSVNFIGRLVREILRITDPKTTVYVSQLGTWYDSKTHAEVLSSSVMAKVESSISTAGLTGMDRLLAFLIVTELQNLVREIEVTCKKDAGVKEVLRGISPQLSPNTQVVAQPLRQYTGWVQRTSKLSASLTDRIMRVGQMQILRLHAANHLNSSCKFDAKYLAAALHTMNESLMTDVKQHYSDPTRPYPDDDGALTNELSVFLEWCGMTQPLDKIYITTCALPALSTILLLTVVAQIPKIHYTKSLGGLIGIRGTEGIDGELLIVGLVTLLRQFHQDNTLRFIQLVAQYITSHTAHSAASAGKSADLSHEVMTGLAILQEVARKMSVSMKTLSIYVPQHLLAAHSG
nr:LOW QUALITY PROTEIN: WASH complex subunit 5-like [Cherax quadricarinatus]